MLAGSAIPGLVAGLVLLVAGRRLYWLLVGVVGFLLGFALVGEYLGGPTWWLLLGGLLAGLLAAACAVFFQRVAIAIAGFLIGALVLLWWSEQMQWGEPWWLWVLALAAGLAGTGLIRVLFEVGLIVLSSVLGATLVLEAAARPTGEGSLLFVVLVAMGVILQLSTARSRKRE